MPEIDIQQKIQNMLDEIPDAEHDEHRREYSLSKTSARWMANMMLMIAESGGCNRGLSEDQALVLKKMTPETLHNLNDMVKERKKILALLGAVVLAILAYVGQIVLKALDASFWKSLAAKFIGTHP